MNRLLHRKVGLLLMIYFGMCDAARILGIAPLQAPSHVIIMTSLFKELALRGHQMTVIIPTPQKDVPSNYTQITTDINMESVLGGKENMFDLGKMNAVVLSVFMWYVGNTMTELTLKSPNVQKLLKSNENFDLIIAETFYCEGLLGLSQKFSVPFVGVSTFSGTENIKDIVGDPFPYSYVPSPFITFNDHMTFFQRLQNTITNFLIKNGHNYYFIPAQDAIMRKYLTDIPNLSKLRDIVYNASLLLLNTHFSHGFSRPKVPNLIEVGGMHIKPPKQLPKDIQEFLDGAEDGAVYFSMGSNLKSADMSIPKREAFLRAFAKIKQRVLWKFEENLPDKPKNVKISKWFPQSDILGHPNIRVFMTHGGLLSSQESMYNAVPLVGIPIFADQSLNVHRAADAGYALRLDFDNITEESVYWALNEVIHNQRYKETAERVSRIFHDQPQTPMQQAVFWVEYVLRHHGARHLRSAALDLAWYQYYLLDVAAVLLAASGAAVVLLVWLVASLAALVLRKPGNKHNKHNKPSKSNKKKK
ncbi:UDP-glycosyltransferase UGT5-like [Bacillus rossius redtenbacheri]|uniref:UDP-glycosyltransferase UGT5-like n=1 Tax=Bacillus rossius redtenbacheri TaxID=93214 RepID=UPI002FDD41D1